MGIGWGSWPRELTGFGITDDGPAARAVRLTESVRTLTTLWAAILHPGGLPDASAVDLSDLVVGGCRSHRARAGPHARGLVERARERAGATAGVA